jgi:hypothetical protein
LVAVVALIVFGLLLRVGGAMPEGALLDNAM